MKKILSALVILLSASVMLYAAEEKKQKTPEQYLADLSADSQAEVISAAADWAVDKKEKKAIGPLISLLSDTREPVRMSAAVALGYIGDETAVEALNRALLNDESADVRYAALLSSVRIGSKKSINAWKQAKEKETDPFIRDFLDKMEKKARKK